MPFHGPLLYTKPTQVFSRLSETLNTENDSTRTGYTALGYTAVGLGDFLGIQRYRSFIGSYHHHVMVKVNRMGCMWYSSVVAMQAGSGASQADKGCCTCSVADNIN